MNDILVPKSSEDFYCKNCDYNTSRKSQYERHVLTRKHMDNDKMMTKSSENAKKSSDNFVCNCGKKYKHRQGLWTHRKKCTGNLEFNELENTQENDATQLNIITGLFHEQLKENKELKEMLIEQNKKIIEMAEKSSSQVTNITNNTTNNTTHNNNFNMQFFLNEQCKDALNIMEFISQLQIKLTDLDMVGRVGYSEGISKIFIRGLKELDIFKRPVHCSDLKRETLYVKDQNSWEKDNDDKKKMKTAIKYIAAKNFKQINEWQEENPDSENTETQKHLEYQYILLNSMGGATDEEDEKIYNKIIKNVAKEVIIDKTDHTFK
jgi:hypothetical protein